VAAGPAVAEEKAASAVAVVGDVVDATTIKVMPGSRASHAGSSF